MGARGVGGRSAMLDTYKGRILRVLGQTMGRKGKTNFHSIPSCPPAPACKPSEPTSTHPTPTCPKGDMVPGKREELPSWVPGRLSGTNPQAPEEYSAGAVGRARQC